MAGAPNRRAAAKAVAELVLRNELDRAASTAADAIRERVRAIPADDAMSSLSTDTRSRQLRPAPWRMLWAGDEVRHARHRNPRHAASPSCGLA